MMVNYKSMQKYHDLMVIECLYQLEQLLHQGYIVKWFSIHGLKVYIVLNTYQ